MVIDSFSSTTRIINRPSSAPLSREQELNKSTQPAQHTEANAGSTPSPEEARKQRRVEPLPKGDQVHAKTSRAPIDERDIQQAQLVIFNKQSFDASQSFLSIQNLDDAGSIIDTYA